LTDLSQARVLPLSGSMRTPLTWLFVLTALPLLVVLAALAVTLPLLIAGNAKAPLPALALLAPVLLVAVTAWVWRSLSRAGVRVDGGELVVNTGLGRKRVPLSRLRAAGLRVVDLGERTELRPWLRLWGTGLPGFRAGWYRLRNGEKAVCLLLDRQRVSYLRSDDGLSLLLSLERPDDLRALITASAR